MSIEFIHSLNFNNCNMNSLSDLEKTGALQILNYIYQETEVLRYQIEDNVEASSSTVGSSLRRLGQMGLLEERREIPQKRFISLSEKGKKIAEHVHEMDRILRES